MRSLSDLHPERILVVMPSWVGDVVMATAALRCIRSAFPDARITAAVRDWLAPILAGSPRIDETFAMHPKGRHKGLGHWTLRRELRDRRFDLAIPLPHSVHAGFIAWLSGAPVRIGYNRRDRGLFLTDWIEPPREGQGWLPVPKTLYYLDLLKAGGLECDSAALELFATEDDRRQVAAMLADADVGPDERLVLLVPGANFGSAKCWLPERFAEVADALHERHGVRVGLTCGPGEEPIVEAILRSARTAPVNFAGERLDLGTLKVLAERCDLMVTNDTGPRHYAVAYGKPVVVIMGSSDPRHTASNLDKTIVVRKDVPCGPCQKRRCPTDHVCMTSITTDDVLEAADSLIAAHWPPSAL